jgi:hypothetical protein
MFRFSLLLQEGEDPLSATWVHALGSSDGWTLGTVNNTQRYVLKYFIFQYTTSPSMLHNLQHCKQCMSFSEPFKWKMNYHYWTEKWLLWPVSVVFNCIKQNMFKKTVAIFQLDNWISNVNIYICKIASPVFRFLVYRSASGIFNY